MSITSSIRRLPKSTRTSLALLAGIALWSALSGPNDSLASLLLLDQPDVQPFPVPARSSRGLRSVLMSSPSATSQSNLTPFQRFLRELAENSGDMSYSDRQSICPAADEILVPHARRATLVLMSYSPRRLEQVAWVMSCYGQMTGVLDKILFVWNNLDVDLPDDILPTGNEPNTVPVQFVKPKENWMTNRFDAPSTYADENAPVILVDDDVFLTAGLIAGMMDYWSDGPRGECSEKCVVGLDPRYGNPHTKKYGIYDNDDHLPNLVIGKTMLASNKFFREYMKDEALVEHTKEPAVACEDLTFSLFVTNATTYLPVAARSMEHYSAKVKVNYQRKFQSEKGEYIGSRYDIPDYDGMSVGGGGWIQKRHQCVEWNLDYYGDTLMKTLLEVHYDDGDEDMKTDGNTNEDVMES
ncbi:hypothetical protein ACHAXS_006144 [Conticribra weissflogii]